MKAAERFDVAASELQDMIADGPIQTVIDPEELEEFERLLGRLRRDLGRYVREYASPRTPGAPHSWRPVITRQLADLGVSRAEIRKMLSPNALRKRSKK